tara:strand:- start:103 stop:537 length:435 start_codon:yes stop_codon:yes gene_type:complete
MGKGISLEELKQRNRQGKAGKVRRQSKKRPVLKSEGQIMREWGQQLHEFERQHFHQFEREEETHPYILNCVVGFFAITMAGLLFYAALEIFEANSGNLYFWAYLSLIPFVIIAKDPNWMMLGLLGLFLGFIYWSWTWVMTFLYF